jgi:hypothetical protein
MPGFDLRPSDLRSLLGRARRHEALVLDMRGNPGGLVEQLQELAGPWLDPDDSLLEAGRGGDLGVARQRGGSGASAGGRSAVGASLGGSAGSSAGRRTPGGGSALIVASVRTSTALKTPCTLTS